MLSINAERYVWHSRSACTFRSVRMPAELLKICLVCIDICRKWNFPALFGIVTINSDSSRITSLLSMICTQASFFDPRRFTYDRPIRHYCKTRMKYFRLSSCSMNYQGRYLHCPINPILGLSFIIRFVVVHFFFLARPLVARN